MNRWGLTNVYRFIQSVTKSNKSTLVISGSCTNTFCPNESSHLHEMSPVCASIIKNDEDILKCTFSSKIENHPSRLVIVSLEHSSFVLSHVKPDNWMIDSQTCFVVVQISCECIDVFAWIDERWPRRSQPTRSIYIWSASTKPQG